MARHMPDSTEGSSLFINSLKMALNQPTGPLRIRGARFFVYTLRVSLNPDY